MEKEERSKEMVGESQERSQVVDGLKERSQEMEDEDDGWSGGR